MFEFLTRRHAAPAETPLSEVRFTREDLFVLLGGCDTGMFANGSRTIDFNQIERRGTDPWRRDMAERLSPTGLVDAEGAPSDELAAALFPLNKPGVAIDDGGSPQSARERDSRTISAVFYMESGTAIRRLPGRRPGFAIVPLGAEGGWDASFRGIICCPPLEPSWKGPTVYGPEDRALGEAMLRGDEARLRAYCRYGGNVDALCEFSAALASNSGMLRSMWEFIVADYRGSKFDTSLGFSIPQASSPSCWIKTARVFPGCGVVLNGMKVLNGGGSGGSFGYSAIDFCNSGTLIDALLRFHARPKGL